eukprot:2722933-Rhodomonas_salina.1
MSPHIGPDHVLESRVRMSRDPSPLGQARGLPEQMDARSIGDALHRLERLYSQMNTKVGKILDAVGNPDPNRTKTRTRTQSGSRDVNFESPRHSQSEPELAPNVLPQRKQSPPAAQPALKAQSSIAASVIEAVPRAMLRKNTIDGARDEFRDICKSTGDVYAAHRPRHHDLARGSQGKLVRDAMQSEMDEEDQASRRRGSARRGLPSLGDPRGNVTDAEPQPALRDRMVDSEEQRTKEEQRAVEELYGLRDDNTESPETDQDGDFADLDDRWPGSTGRTMTAVHDRRGPANASLSIAQKI